MTQYTKITLKFSEKTMNSDELEPNLINKKAFTLWKQI